MNLTEYFTSANGITLILTVITGLLSSGITVYWARKTKLIEQNMQSFFDKEIEKYKHLLQVEFIKADIKTKQQFDVYPELFLQFKDTERAILLLCSKKQNEEPITPAEIADAKSKIDSAVGVMVKNLLFVSKKVEKGSDDLMVLMHKFEKIINDSESNIQLYKQKVRQLTDDFQLLMKKDLGSDF